ncbi:hypothetical protein SAMN04488102_10749 [Alkalibacterium subtropicum]|uniref:Cell shape-determining protein n=1 Tax=Alkalibacterium subtropicum TaxID=753702 RepID=A0A1I1JG03_9LACT|nr:hypothetical protein [Alkalibacterium subtropicum]SFC45548.1 hypothetical protein SAMN04488102_10749 [Alkalibacterium subtropicum]
MKPFKKRLFLYLALFIAALAVFYIYTPALNIHSQAFRFYILLFAVAAIGIELSLDGQFFYQKKLKYGALALPILGVIVIAAGNLVNGVMFRATDYASLIEVEEKSFQDDFPAMDESSIPLMDKDTAQRLGDRRIGSISELVSQFVPADTYTQINIDNDPFRVTPLQYASFIRWFSNRSEGIPNYLKVDMVTGAVEVEDLEQNIKYSDSEYFNRNVKRHLRFNHPTKLFADPDFEVDDQGHPYYIATTYENVFWFKQLEPTGLIVLDAVTGETEEFDLDNMPTWVDRVYSADLILQQLNYRGQYSGGFFNALFGKRGVTQTTEGYNYIPMNDDVYLYTGVTSINRDASNIGFYLVNMRTKAAEFYPVTSADEFSAMDSAEGALQQMRFESTFPLLISLNERPYYISSLKDDSGLVRSYALVDAQDYQKVITSDTVDGLITQLNGETLTDSEDAEEDIVEVVDENLSEVSGQVENISQAVVSGNTLYYFMIDGSIYKADITLHDALPFVEEGQVIEGEANEDNEFKVIILD